VRTLARIRLARAASVLNARCDQCLPALVLMTDDERLPDPLGAARLLPRGSMIVVRARQASHRSKLAMSLRPIARANGLRLVIANDPMLARGLGADGVHFSQSNARQAHVWRARQPRWLITMAAHSLAASISARQLGADAVYLTPIFPTKSHPGRESLGSARARLIARQAQVPVYALGGLNEQNVRQLGNGAFAGLAAVGGLAV